MIEGRHFRNVEARRRTLGEAIDRYLIDEVPKKRAGGMHRATLPWWKAAIGNLKLADITSAALVEQRAKIARGTYRRANPASKRTTLAKGEAPREFKRTAATVNRYLSCLGHVLTVARREWHWISHNPMDGVSKLSEASGRVRYLSADERTRLLAETVKDPQLHTLVILALSTAARAGEIVNLKWSDVEIKEQRVLLRVTKNAEPRAVWVHGEALRLLKDQGKVRRLNDDRVFTSKTGKRYRYEKAFDAACDAAKIEDFTFHDLRHSAATYLAREGATEQQLKAIGGWKSNVVSRYVHLAAQDAKDVLEKMNEKILGKSQP